MIAVLFPKADINRRKKNKAHKVPGKRRKKERKMLMFAGMRVRLRCSHGKLRAL